MDMKIEIEPMLDAQTGEVVGAVIMIGVFDDAGKILQAGLLPLHIDDIKALRDPTKRGELRKLNPHRETLQ